MYEIKPIDSASEFSNTSTPFAEISKRKDSDTGSPPSAISADNFLEIYMRRVETVENENKRLNDEVVCLKRNQTTIKETLDSYKKLSAISTFAIGFLMAMPVILTIAYIVILYFVANGELLNPLINTIISLVGGAALLEVILFIFGVKKMNERISDLEKKVDIK